MGKVVRVITDRIAPDNRFYPLQVTAQHQARLGTAGAGSMNYGFRFQVVAGKVFSQFLDHGGIAPETNAIAAASGNTVGNPALLLVMFTPLLKQAVEALKFPHAVVADSGTGQFIQQQVTHRLRLRIRAQQQMHPKPQLGAEDSNSSAVIGLNAAGGDQCVTALGQGIGEEVFEFADFIAGCGGTGKIVPLDPDSRTSQFCRQTLKQIKRRGRLCKCKLIRIGNHQIVMAAVAVLQPLAISLDRFNGALGQNCMDSRDLELKLEVIVNFKYYIVPFQLGDLAENTTGHGYFITFVEAAEQFIVLLLALALGTNNKQVHKEEQTTEHNQ